MTALTLRVGHSLDSDDAFMFYALACGRLDTGGINFEHILQDIETLNAWAMEGRLEITALSAHAYAYVCNRYVLLPHGASMGEGYGPMVVARRKLPPEALRGARIAVPGKLTSAYLALRLYENEFEPVFMRFDEIMQAVAGGSVDAGLLIHEGQLTHAGFGLHTVVDLGVWWQETTGLPLPLGLNAVRRDLGPELIHRVSELLHQSIRYALEHRREALDYALRYARGLDIDTADRFVGMYVNERTLDMGPDGREAVRRFLRTGAQRGFIPADVRVEFAE